MEAGGEVKIDEIIAGLDLDAFVAELAQRATNVASTQEDVSSTTPQSGDEEVTEDISARTRISGAAAGIARFGTSKLKGFLISTREVEETEEKPPSVEAQIIHYENLLYSKPYADEGKIVVVSGSLGSVGKTSTTANFAVNHANILLNTRDVLLMDTHEQSGSLRYRMLDPERLKNVAQKKLDVFNLMDLMNILDEQPDLSKTQLDRLLERHPESGLPVLPFVRVTSRGNEILKNKLMSTLDYLVSQFSFIYLDRGNSINDFSHIVPSERADSKIIFPCVADNTESISRIFDNDIPHFRDEKPKIFDKLQESIIVILGANEEELEYYRNKIDELWRAYVLDPYIASGSGTKTPISDKFPGHIVTIQKDENMKEKAPNNVSTPSLHPKTRLDILKVTELLHRPKEGLTIGKFGIPELALTA